MRSEETKVTSIEELIDRLEPVEQSEISSDISANVRAEMHRIKRNVSLILGYLANFEEPESAELREAIASVRRECLAINATVSRFMILQMMRLERWSDDNSKISEQYSAMTQAIRQVCTITAPLRVQQLASSL